MIFIQSQCTTQIPNSGPPPTPQGPLEVQQDNTNKCTLKWTAPDASQSSAPLLGFCVERRDTRKSSWTFLLRTKEQRADVSGGMVPNISYLYRVMAENKFGAGLPLELDQPVQLSAAGPAKGKEAGGGS